MKKEMTTGEFRRYLSNHKTDRVFFTTENQDWFNVSDPFKVELVFTIMLISEAPNIITLRNGMNAAMCLDRVKYIEVDEKSSVLGTIYRVRCGDRNSDRNDKTYTLVAA